MLAKKQVCEPDFYIFWSYYLKLYSYEDSHS